MHKNLITNLVSVKYRYKNSNLIVNHLKSFLIKFKIQINSKSEKYFQFLKYTPKVYNEKIENEN